MNDISDREEVAMPETFGSMMVIHRVLFLIWFFLVYRTT